MEEYYNTIRDAVRVKVPVGACRFFASVKSVDNEEQAKAFIESTSGEFKDATHNTWGYKLNTPEVSTVRYSDDREPAGTAGPPIIQAIDSAEVINVVVVVTRYFGGVKLGVGGLIRAYRQAAAEGLAAAGVKTVPILREIIIRGLSYGVLGTVLHEIEACRGVVKSVGHGEDVSVVAIIPPKFIDSLRVRVVDLTRGQGEVCFVK